jgi:hypothetical protein
MMPWTTLLYYYFKPLVQPLVTKNRGCKIKQHPDLLYGSKQRCNFWASGTKHNHWSFPSYFISEYSCMHSLINNQTQLLHIQISKTLLQKPTLTPCIHKNCQRVQASWLQNTHQSSDSYWGLALHMCIIICLAKLLAQRRILTSNQVL